MPGADRRSRIVAVAFPLLMLLVGLAAGGWVAGGISAQDRPVEGIGPDVGEIRIGVGASGPKSVENGVGVGFTRDEPGAVAAATNMVLTVEQAASVERDQAVQAYVTLAAEASEQSLGLEMGNSWDTLRRSIAANAPPTASLFLRSIPVGHQVIRFSDDRATVELWSLTLVAADGMNAPMASWETATIELVWEDDDWKVWSARSEQGPTPQWVGADPSPIDLFLTSVENFEGYRYVAQ